MSGKIKGKEYDKEFQGLFHQYTINRESSSNFQGLDQFCENYQLQHCDSAKKVLKKGKSNYKGEETEAGLQARVMEIVSKMIGATDLLQLEDYYDVHQVCVSVVDIQNALSKYPNLDPKAECNVKINHWV